ALAHVLSLHGITVSYDELKAKRVKLGWKDRLAPIKQSLMSNLVGKDFVAVHMIWGAVNEWSAAAAYRRLGVLEDIPAWRNCCAGSPPRRRGTSRSMPPRPVPGSPTTPRRRSSRGWRCRRHGGPWARGSPATLRSP